MRRSWLALVPAVVLAGGALIGCTPGSAKGPSAAPSPLPPSASGTGLASGSAIGSAGSVAGGSVASASASVKPADVLLPAVQQITDKRLEFRIGSPNDSEEGRYDPVSGLASLQQRQDGKQVEIITAGPQLYLLGVAPDGSILRVELARLPDSHGLVPLADPLAVLHLVTGVTEVQRIPEGYSGKIDLTRVDPGPSPATQRIIARFIGAGAERAGSVPFTVWLNEDGGLQMFRATFPRADQGRDLDYEFTVLDVGDPVTVTRPTGPTVIDAPSGVYAP